jgi:hypothetical protein
MPKRQNGTSRGLLTTSAMQATPSVRRSCVEPLEDRLMLSRSWFVSPSGNDAGAGTISSPFKTIQRAATLANTGDVVDIEGGTYRETVKPSHSGVTFTNYNGQGVTVSGADVVGNFKDYSGKIYETNIGSNLGEGNNEVFVNGQEINEARFPNTSFDLSHQTFAHIQSYSGGVIYDSELNQPSGYWTGATLHITPGNGWVSYSGMVTASGPGWARVSLPSLGSYEYPSKGTPFYISGTFHALDTAGEFYIDNKSDLYVWTPNSAAPSTQLVEVKRRQYAFDLSNVANTTVEGINIFAASIHTGWSSSGTVLNHISAKYITQVGWISNGWSAPGVLGIELYGSNSVLENSTIAGSAGDGVYIGGSNVKVINNVIHDVDTAATDAAGIRDYGSYATIEYNTIYNAGRDGINFQGAHLSILNNTIHDVMLQTTDGGGIYCVQINGQGTVIGNNVIYNVTAGGYGAAGIFLDNNSSNMIVQGNTVWNTNAALKLNYTSYNEQVYNNKLQGTQYSVAHNNVFSWSGSRFYNNVYYNKNVQYGSGVVQYSNAFSSGSPTPPTIQSPGSVGATSSTPVTTPVTTPPVTTPPSTTKTVSAGSTIAALSHSSSSRIGSYNGAIADTENGGYAAYSNVDFGTGTYTQFQASIAVGAGYAGQKIVLHLDGPSGTVIGTLTTASTGTWTNYVVQSASISKVTGVHTLYLDFVGTSGIANVQSFKFATGTAAPAPTTTSGTVAARSYSASSKIGSYNGAIVDTVNGSYAAYSNINFGTGSYTKFEADISVGAGYQGQKIVLHLDSPTGATIGTLTTSSTGSWTNYVLETANISKVTGVHTLYVDFVGTSGIANLLSFKFA